MVYDLFLALEENGGAEEGLGSTQYALTYDSIGFRLRRTCATLCSLQLSKATITPASIALAAHIILLQNFALGHNRSARDYNLFEMVGFETLTLSTEVLLPDEGEATCTMGRLFMVFLFLLGH